jgi:predicted metal-dependent hydrolase
MMRAIWNIISPTGSSDAAAFPPFIGGGRTRALTVVRRAQARGMKLSVDPRDATVRLTLGKRTPLKPALGWAAEKRGWVELELARLPHPQPIVPGMEFGLGDDRFRVDWNTAYPRRISLTEGELRVGGPSDGLPSRVLRFLRDHALEVLTAETRSLAGAHGIGVGAVGVGDPKGRWGSCASSGDIRYSWRLILAPAHVRQATVAHEVAHRVHMNHGPDFHALVAELNGADPAPSRHWLRANGTALHWFGRES